MNSAKKQSTVSPVEAALLRAQDDTSSLRILAATGIISLVGTERLIYGLLRIRTAPKLKRSPVNSPSHEVVYTLRWRS